MAMTLPDIDGQANLHELCAAATDLRRRGRGDRITYSRKVFIPLTRLCRDRCHYCTFVQPPRPAEPAYLTPNEILAVARAGAEAGCQEALFTLGDRPERRYRVAREELARLGHHSTIAYLASMSRLVLEETGLLPHANPGVMSAAELALLRPVSASQGMMLETISDRLGERGGPHYGSPDKRPAVRLDTLRAAGELKIPFTTGILIGIGETRSERIEALLAIRALHERFGHIQEVIVQNFRAKPGTLMARHPEPSLEELLWTIAVARLILGPDMNLQAPPNLSYGDFPRLLDAGINDWGGVSPVTVDHVNPEAPWPQLARLREATESRGLALVERLALYPEYVGDLERWADPAMHRFIRAQADSEGFGRGELWRAGALTPVPADGIAPPRPSPGPRSPIEAILLRAEAGEELDEPAIAQLFSARGPAAGRVLEAADRLRASVNGATVTYVVNRNINYTNVCYFRCGFCAFSKGKLAENLRGKPYLVSLEEIARRTTEAWERGATEVCLQGGIHPAFTGEFYLDVCRTVKGAAPGIHVHAFSPLEVWQGAATLGLPLTDFLRELKAAGLGTLPGTAAEILDDRIRRVICPDKVRTDQWVEVMEAAHAVGLRSTTTIMFGHVEGPPHWARHLVVLRETQKRTGGFTEFVPLPFVHMEAPIALKGHARHGPTFREALLMHAVARLALHPWITNVQTSWVKMGPEGARMALRAGVNDLGGTLMNESISRAAGAAHGQELPPHQMEALIRAAGREPRQRTTVYGIVPPERIQASFAAAPLLEPQIGSVDDRGLVRPALPELVRPGLR